MSARFDAVKTAIKRDIRHIQKPTDSGGKPLKTSELFGSLTFGLDQLKEKLSKESYSSLSAMVEKGTRLSKEVADEIGSTIKDWAMSEGVTHFCHWFQPMTGLTAEKHDSFIQTRTSETGQTQVLERFSGSALIQSEPDASSFPSGGMRSTFEARGYTAWDPTSPLFIIESANGKTLCIPSAFMSYHGHALDTKTPLLRSMDALSKASAKFLKLIGDVDAKSITATLGAEQEYFLVDKAMYALRPDLVMTGRTLLGRSSTRGQQFEDHYFGSIPARTLAFMNEVELELYKLGVPVKTRHNEVAPSQFELAPIFEDANLSADHNSLTMDILGRVALRHNLVCLKHEKPFAGINGSGKHNNWSLSNNKGENLLEPGSTPHQNLRFLAVLSVVLKAVHEHAAVLRAGIATPGNDHRLGANEAPPAIISVFLGDTLSKILDKIESNAAFEDSPTEAVISLGVSKIPAVSRDNTDRNRTSPFAFTGNKFEFRAVGSSANIALPICFLNTAVADSFDKLASRLEAGMQKTKNRDEAVLHLIREVIAETKAIRFEGNNYSEEWKKEAAKRGLPNLTNAPAALTPLKDDAKVAFLSKHGVLSPDEIKARYNISLERYIKQIEMEAATLLELTHTHVLPAIEGQITKLADMAAAVKESGKALGSDRFAEIKAIYENVLRAKATLETEFEALNKVHDEDQKAVTLASKVLPAMEKVREYADAAEGQVADELWPLPKYREMLFLN